MPPPILLRRSFLTIEWPVIATSESKILGLSHVSEVEKMSNGLSFINNRIESILGKIRRVFIWEIFNHRTFGGGEAKLQMGPGLVATSFDRR